MAIGVVGTAENATNNGGDTTVTLPTLSSGDVVVGAGGLGGAISTGYTTVHQGAGNNTSGTSRILAYKVMGGTPDTTFTGAGTGSASSATAYVSICYSGVDTGTVEDATATETAAGSGSAPNSPNIDTVTDNARVISFGTNAVNDTSVTAPSGYGNQVDAAQDETVDDITVGLADKTVSPAGSENPGAWTNWSTTSTWYAATMALRPSTGATAALTGTAAASINEGDIVAGGKTIILTLTGDTWVASGGTFDAQRQNIIDGIDSAQAEAAGWDAEVKAKQGVAGVVRTSDTVVTITLDAQAAYDITAQETITATIPGSALTGGNPVVASPTFTVAATLAYILGTGILESRLLERPRLVA